VDSQSFFFFLFPTVESSFLLFSPEQLEHDGETASARFPLSPRDPTAETAAASST